MSFLTIMFGTVHPFHHMSEKRSAFQDALGHSIRVVSDKIIIRHFVDGTCLIYGSFVRRFSLPLLCWEFIVMALCVRLVFVDGGRLTDHEADSNNNTWVCSLAL